jgi:hypothetical protein
MAGVESRDFDSPDETRTPGKTQVDVVRMGATTAARFAFEPGWRWSECIKPVAGTDSWKVRHVGVVHSGRIAVRHDDGTEVEVGPGEAYVIEPGHDAWALGDERFVGFEFESRSAEECAKGPNGRLALQGSPTGRWRLPSAGPRPASARSQTPVPRPPMARSRR